MIPSSKEKYLFLALVCLPLLAMGLMLFPADIYQWSPPCFFKKELNLYCTFCGGFRALSHLLQADIYSAWFYNPLVVLVAAYGCFEIIKNCISMWEAHSAPFTVSVHKFYLFLALMLGFTVLRNTPIYTYLF